MIAQDRLAWLRGGARPARRRRAKRGHGRWRPAPRLVAGTIVVAALLAGAWFWLRDSSLVSVERVTVTGVSGPDAQQIRDVLVSAAHSMTTLDVNTGRLRTAVGPFPVVKDLRISTQFPHGMRIHVVEEVPVGAIVVGNHSIAAAGDGTLLPDSTTASLPAIPLPVTPAGSRVTNPGALAALTVLAAAPSQLLTRIGQVGTGPSHGVVVQLREGPSVYFGDASRATAKWLAAAAVLSDPGSAGAAYIDVTDPERPATGAATG